MQANSQIFPYQHYSTKDGLSSSNVLYWLQDSDGFIWLSTPNGLNRFDGRIFDVYTVNDGLSSNNISGLAQPAGGKIYIATLNNGINIFEGGKFSRLDMKEQNSQNLHHIVFDDSIIYNYFHYYIQSIENGIISDLTPLLRDRADFFIYRSICTQAGNILVGTSGGIFSLENGTASKLTIEGLINSSVQALYEDNQQNLWISVPGKIVETKNFKIIRQFDVPEKKDNVSMNLLADSHGNIWFDIQGGGLFIVRNNKIINLSDRLGLKGTQINFIKEDKEGDVWVGTFGQGLYCFYNLYLTNYTNSDGLGNEYITSIASDWAGNTYIGTFNGLYIINESGITSMLTKVEGITMYIRDILPLDENKIIVCGPGLAPPFEANKIRKSDDRINLIHGSSLCLIDNESFYLGLWGGLLIPWDSHILKPNWDGKVDLFNTIKGDVRINKILIDKNENIWVGTGVGLSIVSKNKEIKNIDSIPFLSCDVRDILQDRQGKIWIASEKGLTVYQYGQWDTISSVGKFKTTGANTLTLDTYDRIWVGTSGGLFGFKYGSQTISLLTDNDGLSSRQVNALYCDNTNNVLWVGTEKGLSKIDLNFMIEMNNPAPRIYIKSLTTYDNYYSEFNIPETIELPSQKDNIKIVVSAVGYGNTEAISFYYRFEDDTGWTKTASPLIEFASLPAGRHSIEFAANNPDNGQKYSTAKLNAFIKPAFKETVFFYILIIFLSGIGITGVLYLVFKKKAAREKAQHEIEMKIVSLKHQALAAMMNPHFVFNSLNTIQSIVNTGNKYNASEYVALFSRLVRINLDTSSQSFITLSDEIKRLEMYLKLEKMRFSDMLFWRIGVNDSIDIEKSKIPNMILQPFIENSIWHGILPSGKAGYINVGIMKDKNGGLYITISDNGIGLTESLKLKKEDHISKGISITSEKLNLLNYGSDNQDLIKIYDRPGRKSGVIVEIHLPANICTVH